MAAWSIIEDEASPKQDERNESQIDAISAVSIFYAT